MTEQRCHFGFAIFASSLPDGPPIVCTAALLSSTEGERRFAVPAGIFSAFGLAGSAEVPAVTDEGDQNAEVSLMVDYVTVPLASLVEFTAAAPEDTAVISFGGGSDWPEAMALMLLAPEGFIPADMVAEDLWGRGGSDFHSVGEPPGLPGDQSPPNMPPPLDLIVNGLPAYIPAPGQGALSRRPAGRGAGGAAPKRSPTALFQDEMRTQMQTLVDGQKNLFSAHSAMVDRVHRIESAGRGTHLPPPPGAGPLGGSSTLMPGIPPSLGGFWAATAPSGQDSRPLASLAGPAPLSAPAFPSVPQHARPHQPQPADSRPSVLPPRQPLPRDARAVPPATENPMDLLTAALAAHTQALLGNQRGRHSPDAMDLLVGGNGGDSGSGLDHLPGARGAASMEILRRSMIQDVGAVTARIRRDRNQAMMGIGSYQGQASSTRDYLTKELAMGHNKTGCYLAFDLAEVFDLMEAGAWQQAEMTVGLLLCAVEQAALENWHWQTGWLLTHLPEPPFHLVSRQPDTAAVRPFSKLADHAWVASALQMTKDAATIQEAQKKNAPKKESDLRPKGGGGKGGAGSAGKSD